MQVHKVDSATQLQQGSIFDIQGLVLKDGKKARPLQEFYPFISLSGLRHGMVLSQSCDLYRSDGTEGPARQPGRKIPYITIGFLEPFARYIETEGIDWGKAKLSWLGPGEEEDDPDIEWTLVSSDRLAKILANKLTDLLQNNDKNYFFVSLPDEPVERRYFVLNITKTVPLRISHYDEILCRVQYQLTTEFENKLGWKLAALYGRVGTRDYPQPALKALVDELMDVSAPVLTKTLTNVLRIPKSDEDLYTRVNEVKGIKKFPRAERDELFVKVIAAAQKTRTMPALAQPIIYSPTGSAVLETEDPGAEVDEALVVGAPPALPDAEARRDDSSLPGASG